MGSAPPSAPPELQIVFIYDCLKNQHEGDDPIDSILYFHPKEISAEKRVAICGQLMGVTQWLNDTFSTPTIITLQNGKFSIRPIDSKKQYLLALGCSNGTPDWLLQKQATLLQELLLFFHGDFLDSVINECKIVGPRNVVSSTNNKLNAIIQHYTSLSQCNGDSFALTFGILPMLHLPKSANTISLQATILLHTCMMKKGILGGIVMYQTKVIAVEICQCVAQKLALIQPYNIPPAESVLVDYKLPHGVQLIYVYITQDDLKSLNENYTKFQQSSSPQTSSSSRMTTCNLSLANQLNCRNIKGDIASIQEEDSLGHSLSSLEADDDSGAIQVDKQNSELAKMGIRSSIIESEGGESPQTTKARKISAIGYRRSLEDITAIAVHSIMDPHPLKRSSSIADPVYPYIFPNGKCLTYALVNSFNELLQTDDNINYNDKDDDNEELEEEKSASSVAGQESEKNETSNSIIIPITNPVPSDSPKSRPKEKVGNETKVSNINKSAELAANVRRPVDLPLSASKSVGGALRKKQRYWKTFDDVLSPSDYLTTNGGTNNDICTRDEATATSSQTIINETVHQRLVNSFRKLASHNEDQDELDDEKEASTSSNSTFYSSYDKGDVPKRPAGQSNENAFHDKYEKEILFIYSNGPMRLLLLLDASTKMESDLINTLVDYVSSTFVDLTDALTAIVEDPTIQFSTQTNPYCFLSYDSVWKSLTHGGRHESMNFSTVQQMHQDFTKCPQIHELVIRGETHAIYGYQCVGSEVYYQQSSSGQQPGVPMPTDLMGKVPAKAKRRLDRDHSILLL